MKMNQERVNEKEGQARPRAIKSAKVAMATFEERDDGTHLVLDLKDVVYEDGNGGAP